MVRAIDDPERNFCIPQDDLERSCLSALLPVNGSFCMREKCVWGYQYKMFSERMMKVSKPSEKK
jgi:hypothetical protein